MTRCIPFVLFLLSLVPDLCRAEIHPALGVRFHDEEADTTLITKLLAEAPRDMRPGQLMAYFAEKFQETPYVAHTLEPEDNKSESEILTVNLSQLDCTTFVETVMAMALTKAEGRNSWHDFVYNLRNIRYRGGEVLGYPSRLHYIADWAVENIHRGIMKDVTRELPQFKTATRTLDYMSSHASSYPILNSDSTALAAIKHLENGYRLHRFPYSTASQLGSAGNRERLRDGDIIAFVSTRSDLDVTHMGIVKFQGEGSRRRPYVLHASSTLGKVVLSQEPLDQFIRKNRYWLGARFFRLTS